MLNAHKFSRYAVSPFTFCRQADNNVFDGRTVAVLCEDSCFFFFFFLPLLCSSAYNENYIYKTNILTKNIQF